MTVRILILSFIALLVVCVTPLSITRTEAESWEKPSSVNLLFCGDLMLHMPQVDAAKRGLEYNFDEVFEYVAPQIRRADYAIINFETTLSDGNFSGYPMFKSPPQIVAAMKNASIDVAMLANNHCCDGGSAGIVSTIKALDEAKIVHCGVNQDSVNYDDRRVLMLKKHNINIALLNYTYGTNGVAVPKGCVVNLIDTVAIMRDIIRAKSFGAQVIIPFFHWGNEYSHDPSAAQRELADWCKAQGIKIIVGSHPHVVQPIDITKSGDTITHVVAYSLGNFISNQRTHPRDGGVMLKLRIDKMDDVITFKPDYTLFWVDKRWVGNRWSYKVIPEEFGAKALENFPESMAKFNTFMDSTKRLLNDEVQ